MSQTDFINVLNRVKLAAIAVTEANQRSQAAEKAMYAAREDCAETKAALCAAEKALLKLARAESASA